MIKSMTHDKHLTLLFFEYNDAISDKNASHTLYLNLA